MTRTTKRIFMFLCSLAVISFAVVGKMVFDSVKVVANNVDRNKSIYELESKLDSIKGEIGGLEDKIAANKNEVTTLEGEIATLESEISVLTAQSFIIEQLYGEWSAVMQETQAEIRELDTRKEDELDAFDSMLRMSYMHGDDTYFEMLFGSEDIVDFLSRTDMLAYHFQANDNVLTNITETITGLEKANEELTVSMEKLGDYEQQQNDIRTTLETRIGEAESRKALLKTSIKSNQQLINDKEAEMGSIEAQIKQYYEQQKKQDSPPPYLGDGMFCIPTTNYRISSEFSYRISPITGRPESHNGLDLAAPYGTPIYAAESGTVIDSRYSSSWGNVVQIDHGGGLVTLYAHCSSRIAVKGQTVKRGEVIAHVGSTGWSTGNHLHFTVYKNGVAVNPRGYLSGV